MKFRTVLNLQEVLFDPGTFCVPPEPIYMEFRTVCLNVLVVFQAAQGLELGLERPTGNGARYMAHTIRTAMLGTWGKAPQ